MKKNITASTISILLLFISVDCISQTFNPKAILKTKYDFELFLNNNKNSLITNRLAFKDTVFLSSRDDFAVLQYVDQGIPYYYKTLNSEARSTTGVRYIQEDLGLELKGRNITIGVWDGGQIRSSHYDFWDGQIDLREGATFSNHATHVAGTIAATGNNSLSAKGMAPEANLFSYTFNNDIASIAVEASNGLLFSNHSYGLILGWNYNTVSDSWEFFGGDNERDLRFGHYSNKSNALDNIAYNAPYYTIVWSAGNDRSDVGNGTKPSDGPYQIVGPSASSKNIITVGAITGFEEYENTNSAVISDFSSWGPTADGRIKPDLVADGVGVFSLGSESDSAYSTLSGTSMSAPNVTGSLALVQEFYKNQTDTFMTAASLKALAIHTAREAGTKPGPDVKFGWGVLNVADMIKVLENESSEGDTILIESELLNGEEKVYSIFSDNINALSATLVWTDVAGPVGSQGSTDPALVNDLDLLIYDSNGNEIKSWVISSNNPDNATQSGNHVDNVEKVQLVNPQKRRYFIKVSHSGELENNSQKYSLVLTGESYNFGSKELYYTGNGTELFIDRDNWINIDGEFINEDQFDNSTFIFDSEQSSNRLLLSSDLLINGIINNTEKEVIIDLNSNELTISNQIHSNRGDIKFVNGTINIDFKDYNSLEYEFEGITDKSVNLNILNGQNLELDLSHSSYGEIIFESGKYSIVKDTISSKIFKINKDVELNMLDSKLVISDSLLILEEDINLEDNQFYIHSAYVNSLTNNNLNTQYYVHEETLFDQIKEGASIYISERSTLRNNHVIEVDTLELNSGSTLSLSSGNNIINKKLIINSGNEIITVSGDAENETKIDYLNRELLCNSNLRLNNFIFTSESKFITDDLSELLNVENVIRGECSEVLFADFKVGGLCSNRPIEVTNLSTYDNLDSYDWEINGGYLVYDSFENPIVVFSDSSKMHSIKLDISDGVTNSTFSKSFNITSNSLKAVEIIENEDGLISKISGDNYNWYKDGKILEGFNERNLLKPLEPGNYQVEYFRLDSSSCNSRISEIYSIGVLSVNSISKHQFKIYPNPVNDYVYIESLKAGDIVMISDVNNNLLLKKRYYKDSDFIPISLKNLSNGMYLITIKRQNETVKNKIIKR